MTEHDAHYLELLEIAQRIRARELSPVELVTAQLDRIEQVDARLHSFVTVTAGPALEQARRAEAEVLRGEIRGPLHGVPVAVKDVTDTAGIPTAAGMPLHRARRPAADATVIRRLREAGSVLLGKLQLTEGVYAEHRAPFRAPVNPWAPDHWSGASSSGSGVAVAAGLCFGALGSDTGASIRLPSAVNGVTGIRPTWGRVSRHGVFELAATLDQVGPMARSAADAAALLGVIAGPDAADLTASAEPVPDYLARLGPDLTGVRIGIDPEFAFGPGPAGKPVDEATAAAVRAALEILSGLGAEIRDISFPDPTQIVEDWFGVCAVQTAVAHQDTFPSRREEYGPALSELLDLGNRMSGAEYQRLLLRRLDFRGRVEAVLRDVDLIITPVLAFTTPTVERMQRMDEEMISGVHRFTCPFPMTGNPTITLPAGFREELPLGIQLVGRHFDEALLVRAGHAFQSATDWHRRHPPV